MKKLITLIASAALFFGSAAIAQDKISIQKEDAKLHWLGTKVVGEHAGDIFISKAHVTMSKGQITGGEINIDMNSITCTDMQGEWADKLVAHLKDDDFFGSEKHPISTFTIKNLKSKSRTEYIASGDLTIKGITHSIEFPVVITHDKEGTHVSGKAMIDRIKYEIRYGSASFFDNLGDKAINNEFELSFDLVIRK